MKWHIRKKENLAKFLSLELSESGKSVRRGLEANLCRVNGKIERFGSIYLENGDVVEITPQWKRSLAPTLLKAVTLFEDENLKVVDKPQGLICDEKSVLKLFGKNHFLVHRLDKDTTGLLLLAKNPKARDDLQNLFFERLIKKEYTALVDGHLRLDEGTSESFLTKKGNYQGQTIWGSGSRGQKAITHWKVIGRARESSLVHLEPFTGRTHQIRVHMAELGHPLLVDRQYSHKFRSSLFASRYLLHAHLLKFTFREKEISLTSPMPNDLKEALVAVQMEMGQLGQLLGC